MPVYNSIEYRNNYSKTSRISFQHCRNKPATNITNNNIEFVDFTDVNFTDSFNLKVKLMVPLKYLSNFWSTLEMPLINCEITLDLIWSEKFVMVATNIANQGATFSITDTQLYLPAVTL